MTDTQRLKERVQSGGQVGLSDDLPEEYRQAAQRMIQFHANSEIMGTVAEKEWIKKAPTFRRKRSMSAKVQDEAGHAQVLYRTAETLELKTREEMVQELLYGLLSVSTASTARLRSVVAVHSESNPY